MGKPVGMEGCDLIEVALMFDSYLGDVFLSKHFYGTCLRGSAVDEWQLECFSRMILIMV